MCHYFLTFIWTRRSYSSHFQCPKHRFSLVFFVNVFDSVIRKRRKSLFRTVRLFKDGLTGSSTKIPNLEKIQNKVLIFCEFSDLKKLRTQ